MPHLVESVDPEFQEQVFDRQKRVAMSKPLEALRGLVVTRAMRLGEDTQAANDSVFIDPLSLPAFQI